MVSLSAWSPETSPLPTTVLVSCRKISTGIKGAMASCETHDWPHGTLSKPQGLQNSGLGQETRIMNGDRWRRAPDST